jgi:hypothetical protein
LYESERISSGPVPALIVNPDGLDVSELFWDGEPAFVCVIQESGGLTLTASDPDKREFRGVVFVADGSLSVENVSINGNVIVNGFAELCGQTELRKNTDAAFQLEIKNPAVLRDVYNFLGLTRFPESPGGVVSGKDGLAEMLHCLTVETGKIVQNIIFDDIAPTMVESNKK